MAAMPVSMTATPTPAPRLPAAQADVAWVFLAKFDAVVVSSYVYSS
ncbi:MAG: hypothetical protein LC789_01500 [Actinobacteria bacterium]|nr:hypothetical protein [Actinomycetota bacterium]